jgi:hypothetical protein
MGLFKKTSESPGDATSSDDWQKTITALTEKLAAAEAELASVEHTRDAAALNLAMADNETAVARLQEYAGAVARLRLSGANTRSAIALARQRFEEAEAREARDREAQRVAALHQMLEQYYMAAQGLDNALAALAAAFRDTKGLLDRIHDLQTAHERSRTSMLRNSFAATSAACHYGLDSFLNLNNLQYRGDYRSLSDFAKGYVALLAPPPPVDSHVYRSESERLSEPHPGKVN